MKFTVSPTRYPTGENSMHYHTIRYPVSAATITRIAGRNIIGTARAFMLIRQGCQYYVPVFYFRVVTLEINGAGTILVG